ncbi:MAG: NUDIX domain-containing protein [Candidatus Aenigmarchaeota archaeon]|nr:NUDIX domain-containing protein [Candidatus Aenigmarchaeota archaeon]
MELQVGMKALLKNREGKYLLLRRSPDKYPEAALRWDIPGGRINTGDLLMDNLKREIKEETNLDLKKEPKLVAAQDILRVQDRHVIRLTYAGEIDGNPVLDTEESVDFGWFTSKEIKNLEHLDIYVKELIEKGMLLNGE